MALIVPLLGAGFNVDAAVEVGPTLTGATGVLLETPHYPLVAELAQECFGVPMPPEGKSIEDMFQEALDRHDREPSKRLFDLIMRADYYVARSLKAGGVREHNVYRKFLQDFPDCPILTFNYDSLVEVILLGLNQWQPSDGYGVPITVGLREGSEPVIQLSRRQVLHLHGTLCVYPKNFDAVPKRSGSREVLLELVDRNESEFVFDPDSAAHCFFPFQRGLEQGIGYRPPEDERVIAPVPDKRLGLQGEFLQRIRSHAIDAVRKADVIVAIGYSFNEHDADSYRHLLGATRARIVVVDPNASDTVPRLQSRHPKQNWVPISLGFRNWVMNGYPGLI